MILQQIYSGNCTSNFIRIAGVLYDKKPFGLLFPNTLYIVQVPPGQHGQ